MVSWPQDCNCYKMRISYPEHVHYKITHAGLRLTFFTKNIMYPFAVRSLPTKYSAVESFATFPATLIAHKTMVDMDRKRPWFCREVSQGDVNDSEWQSYNDGFDYNLILALSKHKRLQREKATAALWGASNVLCSHVNFWQASRKYFHRKAINLRMASIWSKSKATC